MEINWVILIILLRIALEDHKNGRNIDLNCWSDINEKFHNIHRYFPHKNAWSCLVVTFPLKNELALDQNIP